MSSLSNSSSKSAISKFISASCSWYAIILPSNSLVSNFCVSVSASLYLLIIALNCSIVVFSIVSFESLLVNLVDTSILFAVNSFHSLVLSGVIFSNRNNASINSLLISFVWTK